MSATQSITSTARRPADRSIELAFRGESAAALSRTSSMTSISLQDDRVDAPRPVPTSRPFALRDRDSIALIKKRKALQTQEAKINKSLATLARLDLDVDELWDRRYDEGRKHIANVVGAILGTLSVIVFLGGVGGTVGAINNTRERARVRDILEAGGVEAKRANLQAQLADIKAQLASIKQRLKNT